TMRFVRLACAATPHLLAVLAIACSSTTTDTKDAGPTDGASPDVASSACVLELPKPPDWRMVADGTRLVDGLGRTVFLRGVDAGGRSKFAPYVPFDFVSGGYTS